MTTPTTAEYAAILSTFLFAIKIYELIRDRFRLDAYLTIDGPESDKEIVITNLSSKAIHLKSFELYWASAKWLVKREYIHIDHNIMKSIQIGAYNIIKLEFIEEHNFRIRAKKNLYMKLNIAGQKLSKIKKIY